MDNQGISLIDTSMTNGLLPLLRNFEMSKFTLAGANLGRIVVSTEVSLSKNKHKDVEYFDQNVDYQGVIEINHSTQPDTEQVSEDTESLKVQEVSEETVNHSYVGKSLISEIEDNPTPSSRPSPFLAPN